MKPSRLTPRLSESHTGTIGTRGGPAERAARATRGLAPGTIVAASALAAILSAAACAPVTDGGAAARAPGAPPPVSVERLSRHFRVDAYLAGAPVEVRTTQAGWRVISPLVEVTVAFDVDELAFVRDADVHAYAADTGRAYEALAGDLGAFGAGARATYLDLTVRNVSREALTVDWGRSSISVPGSGGWLVRQGEPLGSTPEPSRLARGARVDASVSYACRVARTPDGGLVLRRLIASTEAVWAPAETEHWLQLRLDVDGREVPLSVRLFLVQPVRLLR